jgi:hypothetical protein
VGCGHTVGAGYARPSTRCSSLCEPFAGPPSLDRLPAHSMYRHPKLSLDPLKGGGCPSTRAARRTTCGSPSCPPCRARRSSCESRTLQHHPGAGRPGLQRREPHHLDRPRRRPRARQATVSSSTRSANSTSLTWSPTEALHRHGHAISTDPHATHSLCRVLTTDLPAGLRKQRMALTGVGLRVVVGGDERGDGVILVLAAPMAGGARSV